MSRVDTLVQGTIVNVNAGALQEGTIAIDDGEIVALEERPAEQTFEAEYIAPGLIDAHKHVESSMVTIPQYGEAMIPRGVTSIVHDPHEIANVLGADGVRAVFEDATKTPLKVRFSVPSSVPASNLQDGGATLDADDVESLLKHEHVVALGEVMDLSALVENDPDLHAKIRAARERGLTVDGHLPRASGSDLHEAARYLDNDHECISEAEAREKVDLGFRVYLREGSSSKNLADLVGIVDEVPTRRLSLCSDDRDVVDLVENGGVDFAVRKAIEEGVDPIEAVQMATLNTAECYDFPYGRIEPGAPADLVLLNDLESWDVDRVLIDGQIDPTSSVYSPSSTALSSETVHFEPVSGADFALTLPVETEQVTVRTLAIADGIQTERTEATLPVVEGRIEPVLDDDVLPLAVIERHGQNAGIGCGFVRGLGLERGAIGSTVAHDAHNCVVAGTTYDTMARIGNHLREIDGGIAVYDPQRNGQEITALPLPVAGLMSDDPLSTVCERFKEVIVRAEDLGLDRHGLMTLSFLALEVIPEYRLTNRGLVDVERWKHVDVIVD
ncbi:adenine deaminase [Natronococcus sp. JC468]|uniref:adenine deaminase n=1 Tax=Natronococcus sp. JC468 TaxID=1961921 RepID=UPI0014389B9A|nr:adenine deaminase [Natronococcus sp. JC468]NKE36128.1 adenine deaminase [Natronococcus sp. JC468]